MEAYKTDIQKQINNHSVLQSELTQLKPNSNVYRKQDNSNIFFRSSVEAELHSCKETLDNLVKEYKNVEQQSSQK